MCDREPARNSELDAGGANYWRSQEIHLLNQIISRIGIGHGPGLETQLREILHLLSEMLGLNRGRIVLFDPEIERYRIRYFYGLTRAEAQRGIYEEGEGITGLALRNQQLIIVQDIDKESGFLARSVQREHLPEGPVAFIAVPIKYGARTPGLLACHRIRIRNRALSDDITILQMIAKLIGQLLRLEAEMASKTRALEQHNELLAHALESATVRYGIIGTSPPLLRAIGELERVSSASASVLLSGESGTGKELFARALHLASPRRKEPFIKVNCAAIPETLFESELFGHEKGAFTGAATGRAGWFEQAHTGTIFLDEIGEMPLALQGKLLRTLQEGTVSRLGAKRETRVDVRLVAATNRDLAQEVSAGRFREDLFYRLNVIPIRLPALGERIGDIPLLATHFLTRFNQENQRNVNFTSAAIERLKHCGWPGNIRQLANVIERVVLLGGKALVDDIDLEPFLSDEAGLGAATAPPAREAGARRSGAVAPAPTPAPTPAPAHPPADPAGGLGYRPYARADSHSLHELSEALARTGGNKTRAAQLLGMTERQFSYRWKKAGGATGTTARNTQGTAGPGGAVGLEPAPAGR